MHMMPSSEDGEGGDGGGDGGGGSGGSGLLSDWPMLFCGWTGEAEGEGRGRRGGRDPEKAFTATRANERKFAAWLGPGPSV